MTQRVFPIPPTVAVFWVAGKFWRAKDTTYLLPGQPTKASEIEFGFQSFQAPPVDYMCPVASPEMPEVYFRVNGRTIFEGPAKVERFYGRRRLDVPHYIIARAPAPVPAHILTILNNQVNNQVKEQVKEQVNNQVKEQVNE
jgi:hypothetical protein